MTANNHRYERKFVVDELESIEIEQIIKQHPAMFTEIFSQRIINNIYLDTPNLTFYFDNNIGRTHRKKIRIRWYGEPFGKIQKPTLEFKLKTGAVGDKLSFRMAAFDFDNTFSRNTLVELIGRSDLPKWVEEELLVLNPFLLNRYSRKYFRTADKNFRLTIDNNLSYTAISRNNSYFLKRKIDYQNSIVELKYSCDKDDKANTVSNKLPFRLTKSSKYVNGIESFYKNLAV